MAGGNRRPGKVSSSTPIVVTLPRELIFILDLYKDHMRGPSRTYTIQRLLETHPELTLFANSVYDLGEDTSPPS